MSAPSDPSPTRPPDTAAPIAPDGPGAPVGVALGPAPEPALPPTRAGMGVLAVRATGMAVVLAGGVMLAGEFGRVFRHRADRAGASTTDPTDDAAVRSAGSSRPTLPSATPREPPDPLAELFPAAGLPSAGTPGGGRSAVPGTAREIPDDLVFPAGSRPAAFDVELPEGTVAVAAECPLPATDAEAEILAGMEGLGWRAVPAPPDGRPGVRTLAFRRTGAAAWVRIEPVPPPAAGKPSTSSGCRIHWLRVAEPGR